MWDHHQLQSKTGWQPGATEARIAPESLAGKIHNFVLTLDGSLRTVVGPVEFHPSTYEDNGGVVPLNTTYGTPHKGLHHAVVNGRSVLLAHFKRGSLEGVYIHEGWVPTWRILVTDQAATYNALAGTGQVVYTQFSPGDAPGYNTQFVTTPAGVVIVPQGGRAFITDGDKIFPLGYDKAPSPPEPFGPRLGTYPEGDAERLGTGDEAPADAADDPNGGGYAHNGREWPEVFGTCRLGSVRDDVLDVTANSSKKSNALGGVLESGEWRAAAQWVDVFGNMSPLSGLSAPITVRKEDNLIQDKKKLEPESSARLKMQGAWVAVQPGPDGTIARNLCRYKDLLNSGDPELYQLTNNAAAGRFEAYTIPDNATTVFPDNIPDSWLLLPAMEVAPMPIFHLAAMYDGRMWIANTLDEPSMFRPTFPGLYGTLDKNQKYYADYSGEGVTGLHPVAEGLLVFTETSVSIVSPNAGADLVPYQTRTLSTGVGGCVAPDSIATLPNGVTVWLGRESFYQYSAGQVREIGGEIKEETLSRLNTAYRSQAAAAVGTQMGEYRCWLPLDTSATNNWCVVYDGLRWRSRDDVEAQAVCVTEDPQQLMLALGSSLAANDLPHESVWVLDHDGRGTEPAAVTSREAVFQTVWLRNSRSERKGTALKVSFWLRETVDSPLTLEAYRDGRMHPAIQVEPDIGRIAEDSWTPLWDATNTNETHLDAHTDEYINNYWTSRRNFWWKVDVYVPAAETVRYRLYGTGDWEVVTATYAEIDSHGGGAKILRAQ